MRSRGFTLVEVLVALLILAVLSGMAWRGIDGMARARSGSQQQLERSLRLNTVIAQWEQDLSAVYDSAEVPALAFDGATLRLSRATEGGVQIVAWSLRGTRWQRWTGPVVTRVAELQDSWLRSQQLLGNEPGQLLLLDDVSSVQVQFYRRNAWTNAQSTGDLVPPGAAPPNSARQREQLPSGVRLMLGLGEHTLHRDLALPPQAP
jgi:general secretion pathway protein J